MNFFYMVLVVLLCITNASPLEWIDPIKDVCLKHKGDYSNDGMCDTYGEEAQNICQETGGSVPTLSELRKLITVCGGEMVYTDGSDSDKAKMDKNKKNKAYQSCYQKKGFKAKYGYWTATEHSVNDPSLIYVYFDDAVYDWYDGWRRIVRCVK